MDYTDQGVDFTHMDWEKIHAPGLQLYPFQKIEDGMAKTVVDSTYVITINGTKEYRFDMAELNNKGDAISKFVAENPSVAPSITPSLIMQYILLEEGDVIFTLDSKVITTKTKEKKGEPISEITTKPVKLFQLPDKTLSDSYSGTFNYQNGFNLTIPLINNIKGYTGCFYEFRIMCVYPYFAYKYDTEIGYIDQRSKTVTTELNVISDSIYIRPVFLKYTESSSESDLTAIDNVFDRNSECDYLIDSFTVNGESFPDLGRMEWAKYPLKGGVNELCYKMGDKEKKDVITKLTVSPFVSIRRGDSNKKKGYYIESYYSFPRFGNINEEVFKDMNKINLGSGDNTLANYHVAIIHCSTDSPVDLDLTDLERENDKITYYKIGSKTASDSVKLGDRFTISPKFGETVKIYDSNGYEKGAFEFRKDSRELLEPTLNLIYLENTLPSGMTFDKVITTLNEIYAPMSVKWKKGTVKRLTGDNEYSKDDIVFAMEDESENYDKEYFMIILSNSLSKGSPGGSFIGLGGNYFYQRNKYLEVDIITPSHELGHSNNIGEFAYDLGLTTKAQYSRSELYNFGGQKINSNVMGYGSQLDFFQWQILKIRNNIKTRIEGSK